MKPLVLALSLLASPALAQQPADPATLILPTPVVNAVAQYLIQRPYAEVAQMLGKLQGCIAVQVPNAQGDYRQSRECPAVTAALQSAPVPPVPAAP